ncbi:hypothetical protein SAMN05421837_103993 [Amycolatopsis pretoriensis]|uniref:Uncharacterized protein n=1 Tax=Amycolatopsis pretoriensis TaxID=218821 RepID=A0A1H5QQP3_9PSEU|nr:hypothetical protein SAMN05421837_103993 [Amycolatopsis pretoriensis]
MGSTDQRPPRGSCSGRKPTPSSILQESSPFSRPGGGSPEVCTPRARLPQPLSRSTSSTTPLDQVPARPPRPCRRRTRRWRRQANVPPGARPLLACVRQAIVRQVCDRGSRVTLGHRSGAKNTTFPILTELKISATLTARRATPDGDLAAASGHPLDAPHPVDGIGETGQRVLVSCAVRHVNGDTPGLRHVSVRHLKPERPAAIRPNCASSGGVTRCATPSPNSIGSCGHGADRLVGRYRYQRLQFTPSRQRQLHPS